MLNKTLDIIPFKQGSTATIMSVVCVLFMFLTALSFCFYIFFSVPSALKNATSTPGYVVVLPKESTLPEVHQSFTPPFKEQNSQKDSLSFLSHMLSYIDDVISHKEFTIKDFSSILSTVISTEEDVTYIDIKVARNANLDDRQFRSDISGIIPEANVYKRQEFFKSLSMELSTFENTAKMVTFFSFLALCVTLLILMSTSLKAHKDTVQTLRFMGAPQKEISKLFQGFFNTRFLKGSLIGLLVALISFVPFALMILPSSNWSSIIESNIAPLITAFIISYGVLYMIIKIYINLHTRQLA